MAEETKTLRSIAEVIKDTESKMHKALEAMVREFGTIRTGRASPALVEGVRVDYYGTPTPLKQLANISTPEPKLLLIQPWDLNALQEVEKGIAMADLGLTPMNDGKVIRIPIPELSTERRKEMIKQVHKQAEEGRVSIRTVRHGAKELIEKLHKDKTITEDAKFDGLDRLQKLTDQIQKKVEETLKAKEAELTVV
ncbi:MAG: ribosome recycling factor [Candidatus Omnitrophica bacterium CG11_big_fil_rev_8_21_14_0_20_64_10]|nr:MAG: ribosome recycling factor [Candidatus Omnitrophica bacterium CG11_big_fil_rev_8_21_14_0_20_64_10]